jgi:hypothetical protein
MKFMVKLSVDKGKILLGFLLVSSLSVVGCRSNNKPEPGDSKPAASNSGTPGPSATNKGVLGATSTIPSSGSSGKATVVEKVDGGKPGLELLKFRFSSGVKNKEPVDRLLAAEPGQRVYAYFKFRYRGDVPRMVHLTFRVNGQKRTELDLPIRKSWSFRTWGYNTLRKADSSGVLTLNVVDEDGLLLVDEKLPLKTSAEVRVSPKKK